MKTIILPAHLQSDLNWIPQEKKDVLWELDFGFLNLEDQAAFYAYVIAIEQFVKNMWSPASLGVVLYRGSLDILNRLMPHEDKIEAANLFATYLQQLASFLPDEIKPYCLFDSIHSAQEVQMVSKDRFWYLHLSLEEETSPLGILLPTDNFCTNEVLKKLDILLKITAKPYRIIPEMRLMEMLNDLDHLIVIQGTLCVQGKRQVEGFIAAGGEVKEFGAEGFEPPTHCSQSSCASQTALCSERM